MRRLAILMALALGCATPAPAPDGASGVCASDRDCQDALFCNGRERCAPDAGDADQRGCAPAVDAPCREGESCLEREAVCMPCAESPDADGDGAFSLACGGDDCDDSDPERRPGNVEVCDGDDEDCDPTTFGTLDEDGDGSVSAACCDGGTCGGDCDDRDPSRGPHASEACNAVDDDCDGSVDEDASTPFYPDADGDGWGDSSATPALGCDRPEGWVQRGGDCDDASRARNPGALEITCDGIDNDCLGGDEGEARTWYADRDSDGAGDDASTLLRCERPAGFVEVGGDCDDGDPRRSPARVEACNAIDDDCDPSTRPFDADGDGYELASCGGTDCDDTRADVHPGAAELCDGLDSDCSAGGGAEPREDADGDGAIAISAPCTGGLPRNDCDDLRAEAHPGAIELCDGLDTDCDGLLDGPGEDDDADGYADASCAGLAGTDCDDASPTIHTGAAELCDGFDSDCSAGGGRTPEEDFDGDGHAAIGAPCSGGVLPRDDCDDFRASVMPGSLEVCNGLDDDCDGTTDEPGEADLACAAPNASTACVSARCAITMCTGAFEDCDGLATSGCVADLGTSVDHCGACGRACGIGGTCSASTCDTVDGLSVTALGGCARRTNGRVVCWGSGTVPGSSEVPVPTPVAGLGSASGLLAGVSCAEVSGVPWCWSQSAAPAARTDPARAIDLSGECALLDDGRVFCGGVQKILPASAVAIDRSTHASAVLTNGEVWCWGQNRLGSLGDGTTSPTPGEQPTPSRVLGLTDAVDVANGFLFSCALRSGGGVRCWGDNTYWQLGNAGPASGTPADVPGITDAVASDAGNGTVCVPRAAGTITCWGLDGTYGACGRGTPTASRRAPGDVVGLGGVVSFGLGAAHGCALRTSGEVWCWGANDRGQLGDSTTLDRPLAFPVTRLP